MPEIIIVSVLIVAACPFVYYAIAIYSSWRFFSTTSLPGSTVPFAPPVSILKPVKGMDPDAYENFATFCTQDYPEYELVFCVDGEDAPVVDILRRLERDFRDRTI